MNKKHLKDKILRGLDKFKNDYPLEGVNNI